MVNSDVMGGFIKTGGASLALLGGVLALGGCMLAEEEPVIDLARNPYIYRSPNYVAPRRAPAAVYVTRLKDERTLPDVNTGQSYRQIFSDDVWDRSLPVMVEEVLIDEIDRSKIYNGISTGTAGTPAPGDVILEPTLLEMYRMREVMVGNGLTGRRRTVAVSTMRIRIQGPVNRIGRRPIVMDETFQEVVATQPSLAKPEEGLALTGMSLQNIMKRALQKVYESNAVRSDPAAAPASGQPGSGRPAKTSGRKKK